MADPLAKIVIYQCTTCAYLCTQVSRVREHVRRKKCRGAGIYKNTVAGRLLSREITDPGDAPQPQPAAQSEHAQSEHESSEITPPPKRNRTSSSTRPPTAHGCLPSGLLEGPGFEERAARVRLPAVARTVFDARHDTVCVATCMFRELWGSAAPREFRSVYGRPKCVRELCDLTTVRVHRGVCGEKTVLVALCRAFRRLARIVAENRLYTTRARKFLADFGADGEMTVEDVIERNAAYASRRRRVECAAKIRLAKDLKKALLHDLFSTRTPDTQIRF